MKTIPANIEKLLRQCLDGGLPIGGDLTLHTRGGNRGGLLRLPWGDGKSVVVKVWHLRNPKERIKSALRLSNGWREWRMHRLLHKAGIPTPRPLWFHCLEMSGGGSCEVMAVDDLGKTECGVPYLRKLIETGQEAKIAAFEDRLIRITSELLDMRVLDVDNQLNNYLIDSSDCVIRVDFECARRRCFLDFHRVEYATMLDRLLRSHLHATHPECDRTSRFMSRVAKELAVPNNILHMAAEINRIALQGERQKSGIDYRIELGW